MRREHLAGLLAAILVGGACAPISAFTIYPLGPGDAQKWGERTIGTPGTVTWSLVPDGTVFQDPHFPDEFLAISGTSDMTGVFNQVGGEAAARAAMQRAFDTWSSIARITFTEVPDDGAVFGSLDDAPPGRGHIRISAYPLDPGGGAAGYGPPGYDSPLLFDAGLGEQANLDAAVFSQDLHDLFDASVSNPPSASATVTVETAGSEWAIWDPKPTFVIRNENGALNTYYPPDRIAGNLVFNSLATFQIVNGVEGDPIPAFTNDFEGLFLHELGHAIGIGHTDDVTAVMCGFIWPINPACDYQHINRIPEQDDVGGITTLYGAVPTPGTGFFLWFGLAGFMAKTGRRRGRRHAGRRRQVRRGRKAGG
ncbi:MAG: hypothetical protein CMJ18_14595 [Phycisphaeraceae bacterium]|nr:hypothetical protein [Phycisphaeraceae bacterium]